MKSKAIIPLALGLGIGMFAVKLAVNSLQKARAGSRSASTVRVVRATQDIGAYQNITPDMVELVETADNLFVPVKDRIETTEAVTDRVTARPIPAGSAILKSMLAAKGTPEGMVGRIPPGYRAVSVRIDEVTGVAYQIHPGDWVDVIVVMDVAGGAGGKRETIAEVILQHIQVAAIGQTMDIVQDKGSTTRRAAKSATLLVTQDDVPKLHLAATQGIITLAMRGEDPLSGGGAGNTTDKPASATLADLWHGGRRATAAMATPTAQPHLVPTVEPIHVPQPPAAILVYHGSAGDQGPSSVERITFASAQSSTIVDVAYGPPTRGALGLHRGRTQNGPSRLGRATQREDRPGPRVMVPNGFRPPSGE